MADISYPQARYRRLEKLRSLPCITYGAWKVEGTAEATEQVCVIPFVLNANPHTNSTTRAEVHE
jgi:hypothetical protein